MTEVDPNAIWQEAASKLQSLIVQDGLYESIELTGAVGERVAQMLDDEQFFSFDLYCPTCKMITPYQVKSGKVTNQAAKGRGDAPISRPPVTAVNAVCLRRPHLLTVILYRSSDRLTKIGQLPSLGDLAFGELRTIDKSLPPLDRKELGRALGLFAHDAPLGAFVYLRRVFERIILRAHERHVSQGKSAVEGFPDLKMDQRIKAIRNQLPPKVVQNSAVFGVLSKGIHELTDEEARDLFPLVKSVIFQMLGDEERQRLAREQEAATDAALASAIERLARPKSPDGGQKEDNG